MTQKRRKINKFNKAGECFCDNIARRKFWGQDGADFHSYIKVFKVFVFFRFALFLSLIPLVSACETVDGWMGGNDHVKVNNAAANDVKIEPVSLTPPSARGPALSDDELRGLAFKTAGGSVEVYDIDAPESGMISIAPVQSVQMPEGMAYPTDPSVTVFPLDEGFGGASHGSYPVPPVQQGGGMTEAPFTTAPLDVGADGKLSPRAGQGVSQIYFKHGSDRIGSGDESVLRQTAEAAKFAPVDRIRVEGHASTNAGTTDPIKARIVNLKESMNRAYAVSRTLIEEGVPAEKIKTIGYGDTVPASGEDQQRRVDIITAPGK